VIHLRRRGVDHGRYAVARARAVELGRSSVAADARERWARSQPLSLPGVLRSALDELAGDVRATRALFERMRRGGSFQDEVWSRLGTRSGFAPAGTSIDLGDAREIEKVFANAVRGKRAGARHRNRLVARDLYAKLSWIAHDERDLSLRVRFSFGSEALLDWQNETRRARFADAFAGALFPECAAIDDNAPLRALIDSLIGRRARLSERIVYSNAPGGGATFHHDDEPHQLGVVYGQLAGETAWLALPKRELAGFVARFAKSNSLRASAATPTKALRALDSESDPVLGRLLNGTPSFTRALAASGALFHLRAGDALLLPSHGPDDVCWHSVFALGKSPSLAHSYGIFALRR
jgi:hypothetical protein